MRWAVLIALVAVVACDRSKANAPQPESELSAQQLRDEARFDEAEAVLAARDDADAKLGLLELAALRGRDLAQARAALAERELTADQLAQATIVIARAGEPADALTQRACAGDRGVHPELEQACVVLEVLGANQAATCAVGCDEPQSIGFYQMSSPTVFARVNGQKPMLFTLTTTTGTAAFTPGAAADLGFANVETSVMRGKVKSRVTTARVALGGLAFENVPFVEQTLPDGVAGALPVDLLFAKHAVELDFGAGVLTVNSAAEGDFETAPLARTSGFLTWATLGERAPATALVDLGMLRLTIGDSYDAAGVPLPRMREVPHRCGGGACTAALVTPLQQAVRIGAVELGYQHALIEPDAGVALRLGLNGFADRAVRFDMPNNLFGVAREQRLPPFQVGDVATFEILRPSVEPAIVREFVAETSPGRVILRQEVEADGDRGTFAIQLPDTPAERNTYLVSRTPAEIYAEGQAVAPAQYIQALAPLAPVVRPSQSRSRATADWKIDDETHRCVESRHDTEIGDQRGTFELVLCPTAKWRVVLSRVVDETDVLYEYRRAGAESVRGEIR